MQPCWWSASPRLLIPKVSACLIHNFMSSAFYTKPVSCSYSFWVSYDEKKEEEEVCFRTGPLQCPRNVPHRLMYLTIIYDRSHALDRHQRTSFDVSTFCEAFLRISAKKKKEISKIEIFSHLVVLSSRKVSGTYGVYLYNSIAKGYCLLLWGSLYIRRPSPCWLWHIHMRSRCSWNHSRQP